MCCCRSHYQPLLSTIPLVFEEPTQILNPTQSIQPSSNLSQRATTSTTNSNTDTRTTTLEIQNQPPQVPQSQPPPAPEPQSQLLQLHPQIQNPLLPVISNERKEQENKEAEQPSWLTTLGKGGKFFLH